MPSPCPQGAHALETDRQGDCQQPGVSNANRGLGLPRLADLEGAHVMHRSELGKEEEEEVGSMEISEYKVRRSLRW